MKKTLLITAVAFLSFFTTNAQTVWNFGGDATNFPIFAGLAIGTGTPVSTPGATETILGLTVSAGLASTATTGAVSASPKTFTSLGGTAYSFANKFLLNGSGYPGAVNTDVTPTIFIPTQRYASFNVSGNSTIYMIGVTGSNNSARTLFITDGTALVGSFSVPASNAALTEGTITYTGPAATLYLFGNASVALYYMSATNVVLAGVNQVLTDKGISYNGTEISNKNGLYIEVYNVIGKKVASSKTSISTANFAKGIYVVRAAGVNETLKFSK
jgi:hypothetical protein